LTIEGPVDSAITGNLGLMVYNAFKNPFSTAPVQGYYIQTIDSLGNIIEKSMAFEVDVYSWGNMTSASISRADSNNGVNAFSKFRL
jgi:hypothetical protein